MRVSGGARGLLACAALVTACGRGAVQSRTAAAFAGAGTVRVAISPGSVDLLPGGSVLFSVTITGTPVAEVTWSAEAGTIDQNGRYLAPDSAGTWRVTATSRADPAQSASATVSVPSVSLALAPDTATLFPGAAIRFQATVTGSPDARVDWSVAEGSKGGSIDASGLYTAPPVPGVFHVAGASVAVPSRTATATVRVVKPPGIFVSVTPWLATLQPGAVLRFVAEVSGATDPRVLWSSDGGSIRGDGLYLAPSVEGTYHVTAQSIEDPQRVAVAAVEVIHGSAASGIEPAEAIVELGGFIAFQAQLPGTAGADIVWSIREGPAGGSIDALGQYLAPDHEGSYHVVAASRKDPATAASASVTVRLFPLLDHGGSVAASTRTFALWWGEESAFPGDARTALETLLEGLDGSAYLARAGEYMRGAPTNSVFGGSLADRGAPPTGSPAGDVVADEACRALINSGIEPAENDVVFVAASAFPTGPVPFCAWHDWGFCRGHSIVVIYLPNPSGTPCARVGGACGAFSAEANALTTFATHEFMEAITDPFNTAWWDGLGHEIGDKCVGLTSCVALGASLLQVQPIYSNAAGACLAQ